jgi:hypothetical protein
MQCGSEIAPWEARTSTELSTAFVDKEPAGKVRRRVPDGKRLRHRGPAAKLPRPLIPRFAAPPWELDLTLNREESSLP